MYNQSKTMHPEDKPQLVHLQLKTSLLQKIEEYRRSQERIPTRSEAIRSLIEQALAIHKRKPR